MSALRRLYQQQPRSHDPDYHVALSPLPSPPLHPHLPLPPPPPLPYSPPAPPSPLLYLSLPPFLPLHHRK